MAEIKRLLFIVFLIALTARPALADPTENLSYNVWLEDLTQEAITSGVSSATVHGALSEVVLDDEVIALDQKQPETTITFDVYARRILNAQKVERGQMMLEKYGDRLDEIGNRYGVQPEVIVALWGMESSYGRNSGDFNVINSLATLAYEGRRAAFFRKELIDALRILDQEHIPSSSLRGSWAGAMGQCQFMPSTYLKYAVDEGGDGKRDIWENPNDIFASIANYIAAEGWHSDQTWGREVELTSDIAADQIGLDHQHTLAEWSQMGVRSLGGHNLPDKPLEASLIEPDGADGRSFLVYDNFRALMRWNRSTYFATSVGLLADRIK